MDMTFKWKDLRLIGLSKGVYLDEVNTMRSLIWTTKPFFYQASNVRKINKVGLQIYRKIRKITKKKLSARYPTLNTYVCTANTDISIKHKSLPYK